IESAIRDNVRAGAFVRGASTLSMQLAKNLYLSRTKTLSRKLQEAALTMLLEQNFTKRELMELYLNVEEFGPGIYGIGPAAAYYFGQTPGQLTPAQAFFIASLLPAPTVQHFNAEGRLSASRWRHVQSLLRIAHQRQRLNDDELARALAQELRFGVPASQPQHHPSSAAPSPAPPAPHDRTGAPHAGDGAGRRALDGNGARRGRARCPSRRRPCWRRDRRGRCAPGARSQSARGRRRSHGTCRDRSAAAGGAGAWALASRRKPLRNI